MPDGFDEVRRLSTDFKAASKKAAVVADKVQRVAAYQIEREAKRRAPVDTGFLRNSIGVSSTFGRSVIGPTAHYGAFVEFGTRYQDEQQYMRPAADVVEPWFVDAMAAVAANFMSEE